MGKEKKRLDRPQRRARIPRSAGTRLALADFHLFKFTNLEQSSVSTGTVSFPSQQVTGLS
jgi:hypothetical protein